MVYLKNSKEGNVSNNHFSNTTDIKEVFFVVDILFKLTKPRWNFAICTKVPPPLLYVVLYYLKFFNQVPGRNRKFNATFLPKMNYLLLRNIFRSLLPSSSFSFIVIL